MSRPHTPAFQLRRPNLPQGNPNGSSGLGPGGRSTPTLGRATISLEEWERQAPLSDEQQGVVREVSGRLEQRELPEKFRNNAQAGPSRPSTPPTHTPKPRRIAHLQHPSPSPSRARTPVTAPGSPNPGNAANGLTSSQMLGGHRMDPLHPDLITTPQEFQDHFSALTLSTEHEQDSLYRDHLGEITGLRDKCDELVELLGSASGEVGDMLKALEYVEERSESLRGACEDLLEEQTHLLTHTSQLAHRLTFFTFLESSQRLLNTPSSTLVLSPDFLPMLQRLDECIGYLEQHAELTYKRDFKDAELYLMRYQQCLTRSMTLIKIYFVNTIRTTGQEVARKLSETALSETAIQALVFPKFASLAQTCRPLLAQLEDRVSRNSGELAQFLTECHSAWIGARTGIVAPRVAEEVRRLDPSVGDVIDLTRAGCSYLKQACTDEFELYKMFFLSGEPQLYGFLESLCDNLYDHLRPRILHEPNLEVLCGVCTVLQALMVQDVSDYQEPDDQVFYSEDASPRSPYAYTPRGGTPTGNNPNGGQDDYFGSAAMGYSHTNPASQNQYQSKSGYSSTARSPVFGKRSLSHMSLSYHPNSSYGHSSSRQSHSYGQHSPYDSASQLTRKGHGQYGYAAHHNSQSQQHRPRRPLSRLHTEMLLSMVLQDAQTRLVFRAQAMLAADVRYYVPKEGDLDYPAKLALGSKTLVPKPSHPPNSISLDGDEDEDPVFLALPPPESQEGWYPTLRMTLWILSCLWTYVDQGVFEDLAQEAISTCRQSLTAASQALMAQKDKDMDARLFLVRHLLILKEMTAGLDLGARSGRRDWGGVTDFLQSLLENASYMLGYGKGSNKPGLVTDAKTDIDRELKRVCEDLIRLGAEAASAPLRDFLTKCTAHLASRPPAAAGAASGQASDLANQPFATPEKVKEAHDAFKSQAKGEFERWCTKTRGYLMDEETVGVLVPPAQSAIVDAYRHFHDLVRAEYDFATAASLMTPSAVATLLAS